MALSALASGEESIACWRGVTGSGGGGGSQQSRRPEYQLTWRLGTYLSAKILKATWSEEY
jgi:hypothetical protein